MKKIIAFVVWILVLALTDIAFSLPEGSVSCDYTQEGGLYRYNYTFSNTSNAEKIYTLGITVATDQIREISSFSDPSGMVHWEGAMIPVQLGSRKYFAISWSSKEGLLPGQSYDGFSFLSENPPGVDTSTWFVSSVIYPTRMKTGTYDYGSISGPIDQIAPNISNVKNYKTTATLAVIRWDTNELSDSQVEYGLTQDLGVFSLKNEETTIDHGIMLDKLSPSTTYYYRVISEDIFGNKSKSEIKTFTTLEGGGIADIEISATNVHWSYRPENNPHTTLAVTFNFQNVGGGDALAIALKNVTADNSVSPILRNNDFFTYQRYIGAIAFNNSNSSYFRYVIPDGVQSFVTTISGDYQDSQGETHQILKEFLISIPPKFTTLPDSDKDGFPDETDTCPADINVDQLDTDGDTIGDACDNCPDSDPDQIDEDKDGCNDDPPSDPCDLNDDGAIDNNDLMSILSLRNKPASFCPECDIDGDGTITVLDATKFKVGCLQ